MRKVDFVRKLFPDHCRVLENRGIGAAVAAGNYS